jgi:hypothetical protein
MFGRSSGERLALIPAAIFGVVCAITAVAFLVSCLVMVGGFHRSWEILIGDRTPFGQDAALGVVLSALGYVFVPTAIGLAVADGITRFTRRRLLSKSEAKEAIADLLEQSRVPAAEPETPTATPQTAAAEPKTAAAKPKTEAAKRKTPAGKPAADA